MSDWVALEALAVTNQCIVVGDLARDSWRIVKGSQDEVGATLAQLLDERGITRLDDFGGVAGTFLCDGEEYETYREDPPRITGNAAIFSFVPKKRFVQDGAVMTRAAHTAGYRLMICTSQKYDKFGKIWTLAGILRHMDRSITYYEDTADVIDGVKALPEGGKIKAVHVLSPRFGDQVARFADHAVSQEEYQREVLEAV